MDNLSILSSRIKELRIKNSLTQRDLAKAINTTATSISAYETGLKTPSISIVKKIAEYFNVSLDWLCGVSDNQSNNGITTYADIIKLLILIEQHINLRLSFTTEQMYDTFIDYATINFEDKTIKSFIKEWQKIQELHSDNTIDDDLYQLWIDKQLKQYDKPVVPLPFQPPTKKAPY